MTNRKRHAVDSAAGERWALLGRLLASWRMIELGHDTQTGFARDRLPPTARGNPNVRLVADVENNRRPGTYPEPRLQSIARVYGVTYSSVLAVLAGDADVLESAAPAAPLIPLPPMTGAARVASDRPYFDEINERRVALAARGITSPTGAQLFPGSPDDARAWDGIGSRMDIADRVWFIADLQRRAAGRDGNSAGNGEPGVTPR